MNGAPNLAAPRHGAALNRRLRLAAAPLGLALGALLIGAPAAGAQFARNSYTLDIGSGAPLPTLPFDEQFVLSGTAAKELIRLVLWWDREDHFPVSACDAITHSLLLRASPLAARADHLDALRRESNRLERDLRDTTSARPDGARDAIAAAAARVNGLLRVLSSGTLGVSEWARRDTVATTFAVRAGPLEPNVDYTFCAQTLRRLTPDEVKAFRAEVETALAVTLRKYLEGGRPIADVTSLREIQAALAAVVPKRDVIQFESADALLKPRDPDTETVEESTRRDTLASSRLRGIGQAMSERATRVEVIDSAVERIGRLLVDIRSRGGLRTVHAAAAVAEAGDAEDRERLANARRLARRIGVANQRAFTRVAMGLTSLENMDPALAGVDFRRVSDSASLAASLANLKATAEQVRALQEVALAVSRTPPLLRRVDGDADSVRDLAAALASVGAEIDGQRVNISRLGGEIGGVQRAIRELATTVTALDLGELAVIGSSATTYEENAKRYVSVDLGVLYGFSTPGIEALDVEPREFAGGAASPYLGVNFYFRPVNKRASLKQCPGLCTLRRLSATLGITTNSIKRTNVRDDLFAQQNAFLGLGWRLTDYFRLTGGGLVFKSYDPETGGERVTATPAASLSLDWDIRGTLGPVLGRLFTGVTAP